MVDYYTFIVILLQAASLSSITFTCAIRGYVTNNIQGKNITTSTSLNFQNTNEIVDPSK